MQALNFPEFTFRTRYVNRQLQIFDPVRKKFVALTPEEWVRQHLIRYLETEKRVPLHMIACERGIEVNTMPRRFDLLVYDTSGKPVLIAECKAPGVRLTGDVFHQIARYNLALKVNYLLITNGLNHYFAQIDYTGGQLIFLEDIADYQSLCS